MNQLFVRPADLSDVDALASLTSLYLNKYNQHIGVDGFYKTDIEMFKKHIAHRINNPTESGFYYLLATRENMISSFVVYIINTEKQFGEITMMYILNNNLEEAQQLLESAFAHLRSQHLKRIKMQIGPLDQVYQKAIEKMGAKLAAQIYSIDL